MRAPAALEPRQRAAVQVDADVAQRRWLAPHHRAAAQVRLDELGLRPIHHRKPVRAEGHLFITLIAYQAAQVIRRRLAAAGERASWTALRDILGGQQRVTATFRRADGRTLHVRTATVAEPAQKAIYDVLGIDPNPGGTRTSSEPPRPRVAQAPVVP